MQAYANGTIRELCGQLGLSEDGATLARSGVDDGGGTTA